MFQLPPNLRKYIVEQNYEKYTPIDQACWRYILRQLRAFLSKNAHECYLDGLEKTGISVDRIPMINEISEKLEKFGWRALPVSGFIPPAAFMELQSLSVLPIASDMRSLDHLSYTPAPDIVHEAAGHAPILVHPEFANYLKAYATVAKKAIISREDLDLYEAIRNLSDLKENPQSTTQEIDKAQQDLNRVSGSMTHVSEAGELSRMNWWTAEYGLIGDLKNPKIFGAGLLSSVGESKWCLSDKVKKILLTVDCIKQTYDITEPQPQLFVTPDFQHLHEVLEDMAKQMAFRVGGKIGLTKAIQARSINTAELSSGIQISGQISSYLEDAKGTIFYVRTEGPTQLSYMDQEILGHSKQYHSSGFGTAVGLLMGSDKCLSQWNASELASAKIVEGQRVVLKYSSGVVVDGFLRLILNRDHKNIVLSFEDCKVLSARGDILFDPSWGTYDLAIGSSVTSVFGGPADRMSYGEVQDFPATKVPVPSYSEHEKTLHSLYQNVRDIRAGLGQDLKLDSILNQLMKSYPKDWLLTLEIFELLCNGFGNPEHQQRARAHLSHLSDQGPEQRRLIDDGLALASAL